MITSAFNWLKQHLVLAPLRAARVASRSSELVADWHSQNERRPNETEQQWHERVARAEAFQKRIVSAAEDRS